MIEYGFTWLVGQAVASGSDHATVPENQHRGAEQSHQPIVQHRVSFAETVAPVVLGGAVLGLGYALKGSCLRAKRPPAMEL